MFPIVLGVAILGHAVAALLYAVLISDAAAARVVYYGSKILVNAIPLVWVFGVQRQAFRLPRPNARGVAVGVGVGLIIGGVMVGLYYLGLRGMLDPDGLAAKADHYGAREHFFLFAAFLCLANSGLEEYYWRWFVFGSLRRLMKLPAAVVVSALAFTLHHIVVLAVYFPNPALVLFFNAGVFAGGCVWAILYHKYGTIYAPWVSHLLVDVAIMVVAHDLLFNQ
ncbi:MAG: CPBP family intramembrane metalloprotease [Planctomycetes bacterium]|nr:CPBP family intramembrane metalloprotease [Planctomycetota bacterium]